jgi:hypothetical protein
VAFYPCGRNNDYGFPNSSLETNCDCSVKAPMARTNRENPNREKDRNKGKERDRFNKKISIKRKRRGN